MAKSLGMLLLWESEIGIEGIRDLQRKFQNLQKFSQIFCEILMKASKTTLKNPEYLKS